MKAYGYLYTWEAAMAACPEGWHLPSMAEWDVLIRYHGGEAVAEKKMSGNIGEYSGWGDWNKLATNDYGFRAVPGGRMEITSYQMLNYVSGFAFYWSSTEKSNAAIGLTIQHYTDDANLRGRAKNYGFSVRCVKN